jgi:hypothetical protein
MSYCNFHCLHHHAYCHNLYFIVIHISPLLLSLFTTIFSSLFGAIQNVANVGYVSVQEFNQINFSNNVPCSRHLWASMSYFEICLECLLQWHLPFQQTP